MFGRNNNKEEGGLIISLILAASQGSIEDHISEVEDHIREYRILKSEESKAKLQSRLIVLMTALKNDGKDFVELMREAVEFEQEASAFRNLSKPFDGTN